MNAPRTERFDVVVVGAGFAGLYLLHRLRKQGLKVAVLEAGDNVGGTWYWNRYPGARCDVESLEYSYSFDEALQQEWRWSERYAAQPEILRYINHVADRFDLRRDIRLETRVTDAEFDPAANRWTVTTGNGQVLQARFCVMATGCLSNAQVPKFPGLDSFQGRWFHTGFWPKEGVDFTGQRVGIVGTGSTGIQVIPIVARQAAHLTVFQRTANYSIPLRNGPLTDEADQAVKRRYAEVRQQARTSPSGVAGFTVPTRGVLETPPEEVEKAFQARWDFGGIGFTRTFNDVLFKEEANRIAREFVVPRMLAPVRDPALRAKLTPTYPIGTKRLCGDTGYFETYNRDNVTLVDLKADPIEAITPTGLRTKDAHHDLDAIIFATGFDAITGALLSVNMRVKGGGDLRSAWAQGPRAYLGLMTAGLPNLFMVTGPGSPSVLSNVVVSIEQHVDWIADCLENLKARGINRIEATAQAQEDWGRHVDELASRSLLPDTASWYVGANIPGKPRVFMPYMGGVGVFRRKCDEIARDGYAGFALSTVPEAD
ncbi:flavin-containing monooxygenase [Ramlibacter sp. MAHUQ-53]|uniref:flavin-containing monooxygenase n=1 Tax=unclassified Ramlibacter TaxID=2617605 RepID=UPI003632E699